MITNQQILHLPKTKLNEEIQSKAHVQPNHRGPHPTYHQIDLPLTKLHYVKCGEGPPLIITPATISEIDNWLPLIQFMGQKYTAYFFELPGHGKSTAFKKTYSSEQVAQTVEDLIDALGYETVSIMGFSFGGVLTMKTVFHLDKRLERVILLSPATSHRALPFSKLHKIGLQNFAKFISQPTICKMFINLIQSPIFGIPIAMLIRKLCQIEESVPIEQRLKEIKGSTIEVLSHQLQEVLFLEHPSCPKKFNQPCYFAMSIHDPLLNFDITLKVIEDRFEQVAVEKFYFPYHQPKTLPTFDELNRDYGQFLSMIE